MECLSYCIASTIDLTRLDSYIKTSLPGYHSLKSRDVLKLARNDTHHSLIYIFKNGTIVSWGIKRHHISNYLDIIKPFAGKLIPFRVRDEFSYKLGDKTSIGPHGFFDVDCLVMDEDSEELKLSFSYGFSQSVKLQYFETIIEALIDKYNPLIQHLSNRGEMPISRNQIRRIIGEILGAKSEMNLISNFLYHPKYFWQHPNLEEYYTMMERYLHIQRRVNAINHRLDTLNEIFDMFNGYLETRHAHILEIIIIGLIGVEIIFEGLNFLFK
ncbi:MAG: RMD1 family protein [Proteobacteria bacterium]|nr:RMD1 family protein [Pseudomonadota bacterium]